MPEAGVPTSDTSAGHPEVQIGSLRLYFSVTILECVVDDGDRAFRELVKFVRSSAKYLGRSTSAVVVAETLVGGPSDRFEDGSTEILTELGFDRLHALVRRRQATPPWLKPDNDLLDTHHELTLTLRRGRLVTIRSDIMDATKIVKWANTLSSPYRPLLPEILEGTFKGDGKMLWAQGVHRRRTTKPDSKSAGGGRLQDIFDATEDFSFALTAMRLDYTPARSDATLAGSLTISPERSHISSRSLPDFASFAASTDEALDMVEKSLSGENPPEPALPGYARRASSTSGVLGPFDLRVISSEEIANHEGDDRDLLEEQAQFLRDSIGEVYGSPSSARAFLEICRDGAVQGQVVLNPSAGKSKFALSVGLGRITGSSELVCRARDIIDESDAVSIYYQSGHMYSAGQIFTQNLNPPPFSGVQFEDFDGFDILHEKPKASGDNEIHRKIALDGDRSIFSWIVDYFSDGWLICDDGPGEVADFLHISNDGTLSAIHAKAAGRSSLSRRISVTRFEQLVSQAEKNVATLRDGSLVTALSPGRIRMPACFTDGERVGDRSEFLEQYRMRTATDRTYVYLVQPHLLKSRYDEAREASNNGEATLDTMSLALLDSLLASTDRTIRNSCDRLFVIGST
ncbi:hypothetical protein Ae717Ps2_3938 [Pseudonocardia sp. Ae717_Ps2]|uniref:hypothetical protein n=1 Tax=Pseudonocardia sp. Ae717_Ps2 TaxID=1885573 RepID=UPI00095E1D9F|nr:hypothetical protein [Pseudonocardia sp. Ae717_Ps2]OLM33042.1 hypothetical protein Ae717Ps2_3938 [Pseudonocardia sp. Ae717_Ps2]